LKDLTGFKRAIVNRVACVDMGIYLLDTCGNLSGLVELKQKPQGETRLRCKSIETEISVITFHLQEARSKQHGLLTRWISFFRASFQKRIS
jgi:hypothetical protein